MQFVIIVPLLLFQASVAFGRAELTFYTEKEFTGRSLHVHISDEVCYHLPSHFRKQVMSVSYISSDETAKLQLASRSCCRGKAVYLNESIPDLDKVKFGKRTVSYMNLYWRSN